MIKNITREQNNPFKNLLSVSILERMHSSEVDVLSLFVIYSTTFFFNFKSKVLFRI
jgi:hypothetical protein